MSSLLTISSLLAIWKIEVFLQWHNDALPVSNVHVSAKKSKTAKEIVRDDLRYEYSSDQEWESICCTLLPASFHICFWLLCVWNVWRRKRSHLKTVYNTAKSISPGYTYTENFSQKILLTAPTHFGCDEIFSSWILYTLQGRRQLREIGGAK